MPGRCEIIRKRETLVPAEYPVHEGGKRLKLRLYGRDLMRESEGGLKSKIYYGTVLNYKMWESDKPGTSITRISISNAQSNIIATKNQMCFCLFNKIYVEGIANFDRIIPIVFPGTLYVSPVRIGP
jgi:hypothetical protein